MLPWLYRWRTWPQWAHVVLLLGALGGCAVFLVGMERRNGWMILPGAVVTLTTGSIMAYITASTNMSKDSCEKD